MLSTAKISRPVLAAVFLLVRNHTRFLQRDRLDWLFKKKNFSRSSLSFRSSF
jgi:hypothetical protein